MNAIVTVVGNDKVGIIAKVSAFLAERDGAGAYLVERGPDAQAVETELDVIRL